MILASSRLILMGAVMLMQPARAHASEEDAPWDAHAAAAVLDASFETSDACQASLERARAAESTPSADIDPRLRDLFTHASCTAVPGEGGVNYAMRLRWDTGESTGG